MLETSQNIFLVVVWVALSITYLVLLNRLWAPARRRVHNDVIGWQISILGTVYAVMVGFMLYAVWANYQTAESNANGEASALVNLFRSVDGLPAATRNSIEVAAVNYDNAVITKEWQAMKHEEVPQAARPFIVQMWAGLTQAQVQNYSQQVSLHQAMAELSDLTEHRRIRILESETAMPTILWVVLVIGGVITIASCGLIGTENVALHFVLLMAVSLLISLALVATADIDRSFQGGVHISDTAFVRARAVMLSPPTIPY